MRRPFPILIALGVVASSAPARADQTDACIDASVRGQELRDQGHLVAARAALLSCGAPACPRLLRTECAGWLTDVESRTPSIVIGATDEAGHDTAEVKVTLDGKPLLAHLEGQAMPLDPGAHLLRFERAGRPFVEQKVILREGEHRRAITVSFAPSAAALDHHDEPIAPAGAGVARPIAVAALGALAAASGVTFAVLGLGAKNDADHLRTICAPTCAVADVDAVRGKEIGANVALGVGALAAGAAAVLLITWPAAAASNARVAVRPVAGGAIAGFALRF
ncbi:MAG: hypothetical protein ABJE95_22475 [Byssovorax sp.]